MNGTRALIRAVARRHNATVAGQRPLSVSTRVSFKQETDAVTPQAPSKEKHHANAQEWRKTQTDRPLNPHFTNTTSTIHNARDVPKVGHDNAPPEMLSKVDRQYAPKDEHPENTERMTGGTQPGDPDKVSHASPSSRGEWGVGEMEGAAFRIEPLRRTGEDLPTMRARLLYQSRKRGTLESDLLLSTFAAVHLDKMSKEQLQHYDLFLDENDWDIYYWATQSEAGGSPTSLEYAEGAVKSTPPRSATEQSSPADPASAQETDAGRQAAPPSGEWAQTVGRFKPAYRPVPQRWKNSEILAMLRRHVRERSAGGVNDEVGVKAQGTGMGRMPSLS